MLSACPAGRDEQLPDALRLYLDALVAGDHRAAYDRTSLQQLTRTSASAATLSFEHFAAFHRGDPLRSYAVTDVTRLDRRSIEDAKTGGTAYHVVDLTLRHASGDIAQTISVDGEVLGVVEVDPVPVRVRAARAMRGELTIDGIAVPRAAVKPPPGVHPDTLVQTWLLLPGAHDIAYGDVAARIGTSPLSVLSGTAKIDDATVVVG